MSVIIGMAFNRREFENKLWEKLAGAASEFYKAELGALLGWPKGTYVGKWIKEVDRLLLEFKTFYDLSEIKGFKDRKKALEKVKKLIAAKESGFMKHASTALGRIAAEKKLNNSIRKKDLAKSKIMEKFMTLVDKQFEGPTIVVK
jgi:hypothetical protein